LTDASRRTVNTHTYSHPYVVVAEGVLYAVAADTLLAMDAGTGAGIWSQETGGTIGTASLANGVLYVSGIRDISAFDAATGDTLWTQALGMRHEPAIPVIVDGRLYVSVEDESLHAFALP
jgi:outer membrane protein assembly factor BamB